MGFVGLFLSMASTDAAATNRKTKLLEGLTASGVPTTDILFEWAFDPLNGKVPNFPDHAEALITAANAATGPNKVLFASCWPTLWELRNLSPIPIIHGGLFHEDKNDHGPPYNTNFGNKIGGTYSHIFQDVCDEWVAQLGQLLPQLSAIAVTYDTTRDNSANNYRKDIHRTANINPTRIDIKPQSTAATIEMDLSNFITNNGNDCRTCALIVPMGAFTAYRRNCIIQAANSVKDGVGRRLIAIYPNRMYVENTPPGLMSYGTDLLEQYGTAGYALGTFYNGGDLPPTTATQSFELVVSQGQWGAVLPGVDYPPGAKLVA
jgi:hypothetical protein